VLNKITDWFDGTSSAISYTYNTVKNMLKARKLTIERIVKNTDLTKKQAKKTVDGVLGLVDKSIEEDTSLENGERTEPYSILEFMLNIIHNIRNNKSYSKEVHQYCDNDIEVINEMVNEIKDNKEWLSIAHHKRLNVLIDKYMNSFDKFRESKKYNGIWY